jgi:hypothetical protein
MSSGFLEFFARSRQESADRLTYLYRDTSFDSENSKKRIQSFARLRKIRKISPVFWNADSFEEKKVKMRGRDQDFHHDSVRYLFPNNTPIFKKTTVLLPEIGNKDRSFFKKTDKMIDHKREVLKMRQQGFFEPKSRLDLR